MSDGLPGLGCHGIQASRANAHNGNLALPGKAKPAANLIHHLLKVHPLHLRWTADYYQLCPGFPGCGQFFSKASGAAGFLGNQEFCLDAFQHGQIHLPGKGALHSKDMRRLHPSIPAQIQRFHHGQHPGIHPLGKVFQPGKSLQFFAAGGEQDVPFLGI